MTDAKAILDSLRSEAERAIRDFDLEAKADAAREASRKIRERIDTDPAARNAAIGVGGLLLAGLLGTRGGRQLTGDIAKTGAVAALGALAYRAWLNRKDGGDASVGSAPAALAHFPTAPDDPEFARAVVLAMAASASADGAVDTEERRTLNEAIKRAGLADAADVLPAGMTEDEVLGAIAAAARTPNHAAELYAAAVVAAGAPDARETAFLEKLAGRLGLGTDYAASIRRTAAEDR